MLCVFLSFCSPRFSFIISSGVLLTPRALIQFLLQRKKKLEIKSNKRRRKSDSRNKTCFLPRASSLKTLSPLSLARCLVWWRNDLFLSTSFACEEIKFPGVKFNGEWNQSFYWLWMWHRRRKPDFSCLILFHSLHVWLIRKQYNCCREYYCLARPFNGFSPSRPRIEFYHLAKQLSNQVFVLFFPPKLILQSYKNRVTFSCLYRSRLRRIFINRRIDNREVVKGFSEACGLTAVVLNWR